MSIQNVSNHFTMIWYTTGSLASYCSYCKDDQERVNRKRYKVKGSCLKERIICILGESGTKKMVGNLPEETEIREKHIKGVYKGT